MRTIKIFILKSSGGKPSIASREYLEKVTRGAGEHTPTKNLRFDLDDITLIKRRVNLDKKYSGNVYHGYDIGTLHQDEDRFLSNSFYKRLRESIHKKLGPGEIGIVLSEEKIYEKVRGTKFFVSRDGRLDEYARFFIAPVKDRLPAGVALTAAHELSHRFLGVTHCRNKECLRSENLGEKLCDWCLKAMEMYLTRIEVVDGTGIDGQGLTDEQIETAAEIYADVWGDKLAEEREYGVPEGSNEMNQMATHQMKTRIKTFPEGQFFVLYDGEIVGSINTLRIAPEVLKEGWDEATGDLDNYPHKKNGSHLLCIAIQRKKKTDIKGFGWILINKVAEFGTMVGVKGVWTYSTLRGYTKYMGENPSASLEDFAEQHSVVKFHKRNGAKMGPIFANTRGTDPIIIMRYKDLKTKIPQ